jgi:hypothetical protein
VKNPFEFTRLLFTGAEKMTKLACHSCSIPWITHPIAIGIFVEGNLIDNFGIQSLEHFCLNFWRKLDLKRAKRNGFGAPALPRTTSRRAMPRRRAVPRLRAQAEAP